MRPSSPHLQEREACSSTRNVSVVPTVERLTVVSQLCGTNEPQQKTRVQADQKRIMRGSKRTRQYVEPLAKGMEGERRRKMKERRRRRSKTPRNGKNVAWTLLPRGRRVGDATNVAELVFVTRKSIKTTGHVDGVSNKTSRRDGGERGRKRSWNCGQKIKQVGYMMHRLGNRQDLNIRLSIGSRIFVDVQGSLGLLQPLSLLGIPIQCLSAYQGNVSSLGAKHHVVLPAPDRSIELLT